MKKFILPIFFVLMLFSLPGYAQAQMNVDCWGNYSKAMSKCSQANNPCLSDCVAVKDSDSRKACFASCTVTLSACQDEAGRMRKTCVELQQPGKSTPAEAKSVSPSPQAVTAAPTSTPVSEPTDQPKATPPVKDLKDNKKDEPFFKLPVFIGEWFNAISEWIELKTLELSVRESEWKEDQEEIEELKKKQAEAKARLEADWEWQAHEAFRKSVQEAKFLAWPGDQQIEVYKQPAAEYKMGGNNEFEPLSELQILSQGDVIQVTRRAIIRTPNYYIEVYPGIDKKAVVELQGGKLLLKSGAATISKRSPGQETVGIWIQTPVLDAVDVQTQYTVAHDEKANKSYVIVSEGEVKVTTKDGQTATVTPNGDKPGIVVVSQKLSTVKLLVVGAVVVMLIIAIFWVVKRKSLPMFSNTGRKKR